MTRTNAREIALHLMFELAFSTRSAQDLLEERLTKTHFTEMKEDCYLYHQYPNKKQADYIRHLVEGAFLHSPELDEYIARYSKGWSFTRIPRVVATMLRISMFEILYMNEIPDSVAINDALEIVKKYEQQEIIAYMNGILGTFVRSEVKNTPSVPSSHIDPDFDTVDSAPVEEDVIYVEETVDDD